jgi:predicted amidohydrolase YtcJ
MAGVIKEGAFADWVVLDEEIAGVEKEDLRFLKVRETWVGGRKVYEREADGGKEAKEDL